jgi:hypothetical protein
MLGKPRQRGRELIDEPVAEAAGRPGLERAQVEV